MEFDFHSLESVQQVNQPPVGEVGGQCEGDAQNFVIHSVLGFMQSISGTLVHWLVKRYTHMNWKYLNNYLI